MISKYKLKGGRYDIKAMLRDKKIRKVLLDRAAKFLIAIGRYT